MTKIFLVRHGIYGNPNNIVPFRSNDVTLTPEGIEQIERDGNLLKKFNPSKIYSSPVKRCEETSQILSKILNLEIIFSEDLIEVGSPLTNIPEVEFNKVKEGKSLYAYKYHLENGGETLEEVQTRVDRVLTKVLQENKDSNAIIVSHGDPLMILLMNLQKQKVDINKSIESQCEYIQKGDVIELNFEDFNFVNYKKLI